MLLDIRGVLRFVAKDAQDMTLQHFNRTQNAGWIKSDLDDAVVEPLIDLVFGETGIKLQLADVHEILRRYPYYRTQIANEESGMIFCALSVFLIGCEWPMYKDNLTTIEMGQYIQLLQREAQHYGFVTEPLPPV